MSNFVPSWTIDFLSFFLKNFQFRQFSICEHVHLVSCNYTWIHEMTHVHRMMVWWHSVCIRVVCDQVCLVFEQIFENEKKNEEETFHTGLLAMANLTIGQAIVIWLWLQLLLLLLLMLLLWLLLRLLYAIDIGLARWALTLMRGGSTSSRGSCHMRLMCCIWSRLVAACYAGWHERVAWLWLLR